MARYALITHHDSGYKPLADQTWDTNKVLYAQKHGYDHYARTGNWSSKQANGLMTGFEKIYIAKQTLEDHPEYEWIWWTGTDSLITNFSTRLEERCNNAYHFIVCVDHNGINADSFLVRNTLEGRGFLDSILAVEDVYMKFWDTEQRAIANLLGFPGTHEPWPTPDNIIVNDKYRNIVKLYPQRYMNSYDYRLYGNAYPHSRDKFDFDGNWRLGDWLVHWPGITLSERLALINTYKQDIID